MVDKINVQFCSSIKLDPVYKKLTSWAGTMSIRSLSKRLKVDMQNRLRNITMAEANYTNLAHFMVMATWRLLRPIDTSAVYPQNEFTGAREPTFPDDSGVQVPVKHDFSEIFEREKFDGKFVDEGVLHYIC